MWALTLLVEAAGQPPYQRGELSEVTFTIGSRLLRAAASAGSRRLERTAALGVAIAMAGSILDAIENLISFVMLSQPADFADWIVYPQARWCWSDDRDPQAGLRC